MPVAPPASRENGVYAPAASMDNGDKRTSSLVRIALLVFGGQILICFFLHWLYANGATFLSILFPGYHDFDFFHAAARSWLAGANPYTVSGFVTPPLSLLVPAIFAHLPLDRATLAFLGCNLAVVASALWWYCGALQLRLREKVFFMVVAAIFFPALASLHGGNMDGLMLALLIAAFGVRRPVAGAVPLAASIGIKLYSIVFFPVALRRRQWRFLIFTLGALVFLLLPFVRLLSPFVHALLGRTARFNFLSVSPALLTFTLFGAFSLAGKGFCLALWAISFGISLWRDRETRLTPHTLARYAPWMLGLPYLVFSYVGVLILPVFASLLASARRRRLRPAEICSYVGFLLFGVQLAWAAPLLPVSMDLYHRAALLPSVGLILMMVGSCASNPAQPSELPPQS